MSLIPTQEAIIGTFINGRNSTLDFLQLKDNHGGNIFGWIDSDGHLQGSLLFGTGVSFVSSLPALCTPGLTPIVELSIPPYSVYYCSAMNTWTAVGSSPIGSAGQSAYFSGTNTISGGTVELDMAGIAGSDLGAIMNNCMAQLPANGGKCKGDNLTGALVLSTAVLADTTPVVFTFCGQQVTQTANIQI